jgi:sterol 3beta-glucosyltransferase
MTTISIVASGTRGDVQPYAALGKGLKEAGYHVRVLTSDNFASLVTDAGLEFCSTGMSVEERIQTDEWRKALDSGNFLNILKGMQAEMKRSAADLVKRMPPLLQGSDLILTGMGGVAGVHPMADVYKIPVMHAHVFPFTPTREFPSPLVPELPFGGALNRLSFNVTRQMFWQSSKVVDVLTREHLGLGKGSFWGPFRDFDRRTVPTMYGYSKYVIPHPSDWDERYHVTGYWFLDEPENWQPPADLVEFLEAGEAPVYIGFGSMQARNPKQAGEIALEALARSGQRGILASGWGGLDVADIPENVHLISAIPHSWLFPRMAAVVHHGGAGTTAAGLRAGIPSIITPFMGDQAFWGKRVADLGVGVKPISRKKLTGELLANAITEAVSNRTMRQKAAQLGENIRAENGIENAVAVVDRFMERVPVTV